MEYISNSDIETRKISEQFASRLKGGEVLCLYGDLGAGKTVFARGMVNYFLPGKRVLSPTFIIVRHYYPQNFPIKDILHVDLYRISQSSEVQDLGLAEFMNKSDNIVVIEWADRLSELLPEKRIDIKLETLSDQTRLIRIDQTHAIA